MMADQAPLGKWCCGSCHEACLLPCTHCNKLPEVGCGTNASGGFACQYRYAAREQLTELQRAVLKAVHRV